ncbi:MAG: hypothetical protein HPKKFMNG_01135 [Planctomycetes bacterium]|nr:hypothetical protein [Planctomycetota bacterium]MCQ3949791.1 hypothetical protein [Planctomycetota bacterium]GIK51156.1 MAG: hypothetical protein BroJett014_01290 [Planctomycetota bacterium]
MKNYYVSAALLALALLPAGCPSGGIQSNKQVYANLSADKPESGDGTRLGPSVEDPETPSNDPQVTALRSAAKELAGRSEDSARQIEVQHLLISFAGAGTAARRSKTEAEKLAAQLWEQLLGGADFDKLVKEHTDDSHPGIYAMTLNPADADQGQGLYLRTNMVPAFGNVGWRLKVGEVGVAAYHAKNSQYGWHIIKRLR